MIDPVLLQASNESLQNASSGIASSFNSSGPMMIMLLFVLYAVGVLAAAQFVAPWLAKSSILGTIGDAALSAISYAIKGLATTAALGLAALPAYFALTVDGDTRGFALELVGYALAAIVALIAVGWLADRAVSKFIEAHPDVDSWSELVGADDVPDGEELKDAKA